MKVDKVREEIEAEVRKKLGKPQGFSSLEELFTGYCKGNSQINPAFLAGLAYQYFGFLMPVKSGQN